MICAALHRSRVRFWYTAGSVAGKQWARQPGVEPGKQFLLFRSEREFEALKQEYAEELKEKKQLIHELTSSNSWKVTKPFRVVGNMIRNL